PWHVDAAGRREAVPLPEARVDLHQLVAAVARVALELDLGDAAEAEGGQEAQRVVDDLLHPDRLAHPARADAGGRLPQLAPAENAECAAVRVDVAADGVQRV